MRTIVLTAAIVTFMGCASSPEQRPATERYERQKSAKIPVEQAEAECYAIRNSPATPTQSLAQCMKGKGYAEK